MTEKVLKCGFCDNEIEICDYCYKELKKGKEIICLSEGEHHFCSKKCLHKWIKENALPADPYYAKHLKSILKEWQKG